MDVDKSKIDDKDQESIQSSNNLTQDITLESEKISFRHPNKSQEVNPFPEGDHKAALNRRESMTNTIHK